ncbi:MAG: DNA-processing protein DprA [Patescibacteria group bacterium]
MSSQEKIYWLFFSLIPEIGPVRFKKLYSYFKNLGDAYAASSFELLKAGLEEKMISIIQNKKKEIALEKEWQKLEKEKISLMTIKDTGYPALLKEIYDPPAVLYWQGEFINPSEFLFAVVGTRKPSSYGRQATEEIVRPLAQNKISIVSGLALGIDAVAHQATLDSGGRTIAVLGSGLDIIHPRLNYRLAEKILENRGLILSEFPLGSPPLKPHFPQRNRVIAGLSLGTLIIEAPLRSGALITARFALEQNREVFCLPGSIFSPNSLGPNNLIKMGARPVTSYTDILNPLNLEMAGEFQENQTISPDTAEEKIILKILSRQPLHIDKIIEGSKLKPSIINSALTLMEMKGMVKNIGGMHYVLGR